jgi:MurNAc alpha-1-phosphate uridylyltransferase
MGAYHPEIFAPLAPGSRRGLAALLCAPIRSGQVSGELHQGLWFDVGTPERLAQLDRLLGSS